MENQNDDKGAFQNIARATAVISVLAESSAIGLRLTDVIAATGLGKATAHRILTGLAAHGLADQDEASGRFFLGMKMLSWAAAAADRFDLAKLVEPSLVRLCQSTQDTVYLTLLSGDLAVCLARHEGTFPIKALTLKVGDHRPLGIGAGSLALLAALPDAEAERLLAIQANMRAVYPFDDIALRQMIADVHHLGYAYNDIHVYPGMDAIHGMGAVALPVRRSDGKPICAISVAAITSRMQPPRRGNIVDGIRAEIEQIEVALRAALSNPATVQILQTRSS